MKMAEFFIGNWQKAGCISGFSRKSRENLGVRDEKIRLKLLFFCIFTQNGLLRLDCIYLHLSFLCLTYEPFFPTSKDGDFRVVLMNELDGLHGRSSP